jgi:hypothetical protein
VADIAKLAKVAQVAEKVGNGAITRDMLSSEVLAQLDANATVSPSAPVTITRDMLPQDVRDDLNKTVTITRSMLPADVLSDLNRTISKSMLGSDVLADLNKSSTTASPITLSMLAPEVTAKLDQNGSGGNTTVVNPPAVGSLIALPYGQNAPAGYSLYQRGEPKKLVWEKLREASSDLNVSLSVSSTIQNEIFMTRGHPPSTQILKFNPVSNQVVNNINMQTPRWAASTANFNDLFYVVGGSDGNTNLSSVEIYNPSTNQWSFGPTLPLNDRGGQSIVFNNDLYYFSGIGGKGIYKLDDQNNIWAFESNMTSEKWMFDLVVYENKIWILGGKTHSSGGVYPRLSGVEIYDPLLKNFSSVGNMIKSRENPDSWVANNLLFVAGGGNGSEGHFSIEVYNPVKSSWELVGDLPTKGGVIEIVGNYIYTVKGELPDENATDYVYRYNLELFDLYRKDGNASAGTPIVQAEVADGSVTASKLANNTITTSQLNEQILKYLKPDITIQPQAQTVYDDTNATFSVTAEGKYLTYQWKKNGISLGGETNATLNIIDANATLHDGNYSAIVSNDFGSVESNEVLLDVNTSLLDGLVGWWKFDETNGTIAYDFSGNGNDGNLTNGPTWTIGKIGGALSFDGVDDRVKIPHTILDQKLAFTVSLWFNMKMGSDSSYHAFITAANSSNANAFTFEKRPDHNMMIRDMGEDSISAAKTSDFWTSTWRHVTLAKSSLGIVFYLSGEELYSKNYSTATTSVDANGLWIGPDQDSVGGGWQSGQSVKGELDDYRIYDRALSAAEVQALYNMGQ